MNKIGSFDVSVVVPTFQADEKLPQLVKLLQINLGSRLLEIILVDDGSDIKSWRGICKIASDNVMVEAVRLARNYGQHAALLAGIRLARGRIVVTLDDDLQNPPDQIFKLLDALGSDIDLVYGSLKNRPLPLIRKFLSFTYRKFLRVLTNNQNVGLYTQFRAFKTELREVFSDVKGPSVSVDALLSWSTTQVKFVEIDYDNSKESPSRYTVRTLIRHAGDNITVFGRRPLQTLGLIGLLVSAVFFHFLTVLVCIALFSSVSLDSTLVILVAVGFTSGLQLLSVAALGESLGRIHARSVGQPT